ncbi:MULTISPECIES: HAD-IA family hydrolase [Paracoccus]|uniref:HAD superfamily hydrolase (TIGR01509 family) n=1 Tax=Paracoccus versutus TaxID=34007 RepID=A0A3D9XZ46_PARVE|nr:MULTISPECIES: HAD-IA family hydrolase [Paracoccus]WGR63392.1 HAD family hydrolase [Paracoccus ferrooxidans]MBT0782140.1 HAD-IA family hydrolase [Paracoccus sp. pheM1]MCJ1901736.1 HAD-IA family hydrolase [Paracoccus versutus]MDF3906594.1 HAD-IA family hydrolase [Paracoccus sp. AS002]REF72209.1 HAD superfamily hydrolase (TIGR01509 family) [Paracoccus versutus]
MARGLIFDCDGVLVDSEPLAAAEIEALLQGLGAPITRARIYDEFLGRSFSTIVEAARDQGVDLGPALPGYAEALALRFRRELRPVPGMAEALAQLSGPRAVASSSAPERLQLSLSLTGLAPLFGPHVYSATQVARGKPEPDLFLFAARHLGIAPADCVVIEDSPAGLRAARAAGMRVIGFLGGSHAAPARLAEKLAALAPDALIDQARDLPKTLAGLG